MCSDISEIDSVISDAKRQIDQVREEIGKVVIGQKYLIDRMLLTLLVDGHILLEGVPGLAKTLAVNTFAKVLASDFKRIQFTPDLLPADLIGTSVYNPKEGNFSVKKGPVFSNILLGDEINRAPPKVQSALLEVMQEKQVTIQGETFHVGKPFMVLATQNPIEQEGTYPLPEAQTDRFMMKVKIDYPSKDEEREIIHRMGTLTEKPKIKQIMSNEDIEKAKRYVREIFVDEKITDYILDIIFSTRHPEKFGVKIEGLLQFGASPRASIHLKMAAQGHAFLSGRAYVTPHDVKSVVHDVLRHRLRRTYEAEAEEISSDEIIDRILETIIVP
ncbi:MAG: AAA family ATPase [Chlamydiales bacterium]